MCGISHSYVDLQLKVAANHAPTVSRWAVSHERAVGATTVVSSCILEWSLRETAQNIGKVGHR